MIYLHVFFLFSVLLSQSSDTSINIIDFIYPEIDDIQIILDEGGENTYFINSYYPLFMDDFSRNQVLIDGSLQLPQGSYVFPKLFPLTIAPDSILDLSLNRAVEILATEKAKAGARVIKELGIDP